LEAKRIQTDSFERTWLDAPAQANWKATMALSLKDHFWMKAFGYRPMAHTEDIGWTVVHTHGIIKAPIHSLRASIQTAHGRERRTIAHTPHFAWIRHLVQGTDNHEARQGYIDYIETFSPDFDPPIRPGRHP